MDLNAPAWAKYRVVAHKCGLFTQAFFASCKGSAEAFASYYGGKVESLIPFD